MKNCQAKDPMVCRVHGRKHFRPVSYADAVRIHSEILSRYDQLKDGSLEQLQVRREVAEAQFLIYTTPEGQSQLHRMISTSVEPELKRKYSRILDYAKATRLSQEIYEHELATYHQHPADKYLSIVEKFGITIKHYNTLLMNAEPYKRQRKLEENKIDPTLVALHGKERHIHMKTMAALAAE